MDEDEYELKVPNYELRKVFKDIVLNWWTVEHKVARILLKRTAQHLINNRIKDFEKGFKKIIGDTFSYFDFRGEPENVYQAYTLGLLAILGDEYIIKSNRESGDGRYDILLLPRDKSRYGVVIEIKQIESKEKEEKTDFIKKVNDKLDEAANQIEEKEYYKELLAHHIQNILKVPIVFVGKTPYVTRLSS